MTITEVSKKFDLSPGIYILFCLINQHYGSFLAVLKMMLWQLPLLISLFPDYPIHF